VLAHLPAAKVAYLTGRSFFPRLISGAFANGLHLAFDFAAGASVVAAVASLLRGGRYFHRDEATGQAVGEGLIRAGALASEEVGAGFPAEEPA
jgi:hypothetical protein